MGFRCGIVGLPNVGKSTIFNALTAARAAVANYPFTTIDPNVGIVPVPDERLARLAKLTGPEKVTPTALEFVDVAGLVRDAAKGAGRGNQFLSHVRDVDAIVHVVRCFPSPDVVHVEGSIDPVRDAEIIELELVLADLEVVERRQAKVEKLVKVGMKESEVEHLGLQRLAEALSAGRLARTVKHGREEAEALADLALITRKPLLIVANVSEGQLKAEDAAVEAARRAAGQRGAPFVVICGDLESEIQQLEDPADRAAFLADLGLEETGLSRLVREGYAALDLITFYTTVGPELRAWTVPRGTPAPKAAGRIHTDFERGFIRAEVVPFPAFVAAGSETAARAAGIIRSEGKEYLVQDGDIVRFRFNV